MAALCRPALRPRLSVDSAKAKAQSQALHAKSQHGRARTTQQFPSEVLPLERRRVFPIFRDHSRVIVRGWRTYVIQCWGSDSTALNQS